MKNGYAARLQVLAVVIIIIVTASTTSEMAPTTLAGSMAEEGNMSEVGNIKPVTLVATVVVRKSAVQALRRIELNMPNTTMRPVTMPIRLKTM